MSDRNPEDIKNERLEILRKSVNDINLFLMSKFPDYWEEKRMAREKINEAVVEKLCQKAVDEVMKKLKDEEWD